ncbi:MAG TPA: HGGxSTG domain-containing protein [Methylomirabilota bacterium]|nr:HGGxSTG domain-containing protein [Methylomirabilota bacterium]
MTAATATVSAAGHGLHPSFSPSASSLPQDRRGRLRNGARPGDFLTAPRCGARTRCGGSCRQPAMRNGRCRMHGGLSTGPRTAEGRARCARARLTHGGYSAATRALRADARAWTRRIRGLVAVLRPRRTAGHGVLASDLMSAVGATGRSPVHPAHRTGDLPVAPTRDSAICVHPRSSAASSPSTAGHGVLPPISRSRPSPRAVRLLSGAAPLAPFSAGHGLLPSFSAPGQFPADHGARTGGGLSARRPMV